MKMYSATASRRRLTNPEDKYPHIANNGLRVTKRNSQAVSLAWPENDHDVVTYTNSGNVSCMDIETELDTLGNWFEVQMKYGEDGSAHWTTIYKGYGQRCEVDDLVPDSMVLFRMKRNGEKRWGTEIIASTEPPPVTTDDLNRAVEMNSEYLVTRILGNTQATHLKRIMGAHDKNGMTPLMVACHNGNLQIVKMLLSCGARVNDASTGVGRTPLMFACIQGKLNIVQVLDQNGVDWQAKDKSGCNAMHHAINGGNIAIVRFAFAKLGPNFAFDMDHCGWTPLMRAAILSDSLDIIKFLVGKGADLNFIDRTNSKSVLMASILSRKPEFVQFLLEWGADPFYKNKNGKNCFEVAKGLGYRDIAKMIRERMQRLETTLTTKPSFALPTEEDLPFDDTKRKISRSFDVDSTINVLVAPPTGPKLVIAEESTPTDGLEGVRTKYASLLETQKLEQKQRQKAKEQRKKIESAGRDELTTISPRLAASRFETKFLMRPGPDTRRW